MQLKPPMILAVEDNLKIRRFLKTAMLAQHCEFLEAGTGKEALEIAKECKPEIILLDLGLPDMDGLSIIKQIRAWTSTPIIVLSARDQEGDKIMALDLGADDYLTKPFSIGELNARVRVALRHVKFINDNETSIFETAGLKVDLANHQVWVNKKVIALSPTQFAILSVLVKRVNKIVTHKQLLKEVWGEQHKDDVDYLRIYIHQLRQKLEEDPQQPKYFMTEPGIGYRLVLTLSGEELDSK